MSTEESTRCCRSAILCVSSKAAFFSLAWSFGVNLLYDLFYQSSNYVWGYDVLIVAVIYAAGAIVLSFYPLAGFLADNKFGRYKTIVRSLGIIVVSIIVAVPSLYIFLYLLFYTNKDYYIGMIGAVIVSALVFFPMTAACIGFNANVIQFGMDQLHDSPADHQRLFIHWYIWIYYFVLLITRLPWTLRQIVPSLVLIIVPIYVVLTIVLLVVSIVFAYRRKHWFIIDMGRINPYKMVYRVSKFSEQHKVPIHRSAFTYCEDELPTGLDLGKRKYGGPFTIEEMEDVKVFYEILKLLLSLGPTFFLYIASDPALQWYVQHTYYVPRNAVHVYEEYRNNTIDHFNFSYITFKPYNTEMTMFLQSIEFSYLLIVILLPLYLCTLRSILFRYMPSMMTRIGIGIVFSVMSLISTFVLDTIAHYNRRSINKCMFVPTSGAPILENITLTIIPRSFTALSDMFIYIALYEFICAQSPHSMKGFLIGLSFAIKGLFQALAALLIIPFSFVTSSFPSCGMYYYIMNISVGMLALLVYVGVAKRYKYRKRDENCDIYRYAEEYYSNGN